MRTGLTIKSDRGVDRWKSGFIFAIDVQRDHDVLERVGHDPPVKPFGWLEAAVPLCHRDFGQFANYPRSRILIAMLPAR